MSNTTTWTTIGLAPASNTLKTLQGARKNAARQNTPAFNTPWKGERITFEVFKSSGTETGYVVMARTEREVTSD